MKKIFLFLTILLLFGCEKKENKNDNEELYGSCWSSEWIKDTMGIGIFLDYRYRVCFSALNTISWSTTYQDKSIFDNKTENPIRKITYNGLSFDYKNPNIFISGNVKMEGKIEGNTLTIVHDGVTYIFFSEKK